MKNILYSIAFFAMPLISCSQTNYNEMATTDFYNIKFDNVALAQLSNFQGDNNDLNQLFSMTFTNTSNDSFGEAKDYENDDLLISYFGYPPELEFSGLFVKSSNVVINIDGTNISVGDNISDLGYGNPGFNSFLNSNDSSLSIAIFKPEYNDSYVSIYFKSESGIIEEIRYLSPS